MTVAQGIYKKLAYKKQSALGTAASGASGQYLRREKSSFNKMKDTYSNDEIVSHQQYTGDTYGVGKTKGDLNGVLSPGTYATLLGSLLRKDMTATAAVTAVTLTIAGSGPYTVVRSAGSWLTDGVKIGDVVRITAGTYTGTARDINLLVTGVVALTLTVLVPNGSTLTAQGPVASSTLTVIGKKSVVPITGHTNDYYTFEEWFNDLSKSRTYVDTQISMAEIGIPATGNSTIKLEALGLSRAKGSSQVLTSPTAETTTNILTAANAMILVNGSRTLVGTSLSLKVDDQLQYGDAVIGSNSLSDVTKGDVKVSGSVSVQYDGETVSTLFDNETVTSIIAVLFDGTSATADFIGFTIPAVKLMKDDIDDGKKQLVMACDFTAQINTSGGAVLANDQGIISIQDSQAA
jgi:hypothetical protein